MRHKLFRLFFVLTFVVGLALVSTPQPAHAASPWYVSTAGNDANDCQSPTTPCATINSAIGKATAGDTINVAVGTYTGTGSEVLLIDKDVTLSGGWDSSFSTQNGASVIDGEFTRRVVTVPASIKAYIEYFVVQNGDSIDGKNGINNDGNLILEKVTIQNNGTSPGSGGISGINNSVTGVLTLRNSAVINNGTVNNCFGGIWNQGSLAAINSTISGNVSNTIYCYGAALIGYGAVSLRNTTIVNNTGNTDMMGAFGTFTLQNSLIGSCGNSTSMTSQGYNMISSNDCPITPATADQFGTSSAPINLLIGTLQNNGGPTFTHALLSLSLAIDAGDPAGCTDQNGNPLITDQRGFVRPQGTRCDIGAYEYADITVGPATSLSALSGGGQSTALNFAFPQPLRVVALDNQGNRVSGVTVTFTAPTSGASGTFAATGTNINTIDTDAGGAATTSIFTANDQAGAYTVSASANGLGSVDFSLEQVFRPANDNFANAGAITSLPFSTTVDITDATNEPDEPQNCYSMGRTVWYSFTPTETMTVRIDAHGSAVSGNVNIYVATGSGIPDLQFLNCTDPISSRAFLAEAGQTYYLQAGSAFGEVGNIQINLVQIFPPANDNFTDAEEITSVPFSTTLDITDATIELGEQQNCYSTDRTVWYSFTPTESVVLRADTQGGAVNGNLNIYHAAGPGISDLQFIGCAIPGGSSTFLAEAGQTYYLQASSATGEVGNIQINLEQVPPPANDDFANAADVGPLPSTIDFDSTGATFQNGETSPSCAYPAPPYKTLWYAFTASQDGLVSASVPNSNFSPFVGVYSGASLGNLTQLSCGQYSNRVTFHVTNGQTYYIQLGGFYGAGGTCQFLLEVAPPPQAGFYYYPEDPSKFDTIQFQDNSYDPGNVGLQSYAWTFGDGTSANISSPTHKYTTDGDYQVTHMVTTSDGRTGTVTQTVQVRTHDVAITKIAAPVSANAGQTKTITVSVRNKNYPETVQIDLYKSTPNGFVWIATVTKQVAVSTGNRTTSFNFSYKFTNDDAKLGKVTFKVVATIIGAPDAYPSDNTAIATTRVSRGSYP